MARDTRRATGRYGRSSWTCRAARPRPAPVAVRARGPARPLPARRAARRGPHRGPPDRGGTARLRRQRQPRAQDPGRRALPALRGRHGRLRRPRGGHAASPAGCRSRRPGSTNLVQELIDLSRVQNDDPLEDAEPVSRGRTGRRGHRPRRGTAASTKQITMAAGGTADLRVWGTAASSPPRSATSSRTPSTTRPARTRVGIAARAPRPAATHRDRRHRPGHRHLREGPRARSSSASTASTRPAPAPPAAPASAWPSSSTWPPRTAGRSRVWSAEGQGSTFTLRLPEAAAVRRPPTPRPDRSPPTPSQHHDQILPRRSFRDPSARRRGRGILQRRPVLHAPQGGLRGRHRDHRARRPRRVRAQRRRPRPARPDAARPARHRGLPPAARPLQRPGHHGDRQGQRDRQGRRAWR